MTDMSSQPILYLHNEPAGRALVDRLRGRRPLFACVIAHTDLCEIPGISAAGATPELRRYTPAADVEVLHHGQPRCIPDIPINPLGPPSPVVITAAALKLAALPYCFISAGLKVKPDVPLEQLGSAYGGDIRVGQAVPAAPELFERGRLLGRRLGNQADYLVIGESVPGGTTTALALMLALGLEADGKVSSSLAENPHALKTQLVGTALAAAWPDGRPSSSEPLAVVSEIGDPMQPVAAGLALGALEHRPVLLAGGTQMAAVLALMAAIERAARRDLPTERLAVATTRWVATDPSADLQGLARQIGPVPFLAADLNFASSRHAGLRRYEEFLVKEGVGAGGAAVAAVLAAEVSHSQLLSEIERVYEELVEP
jgi:uncharacterized protein (TIGR00303 family)